MGQSGEVNRGRLIGGGQSGGSIGRWGVNWQGVNPRGQSVGEFNRRREQVQRRGGEEEGRGKGGGGEEGRRRGRGGGGGTVCTEEDAKGAGSAVKRRESDRVVPIRAREQRLCAMQQQKIDQRRVAVHGRVHQRGDARVVGSIDVNALL